MLCLSLVLQTPIWGHSKVVLSFGFYVNLIWLKLCTTLFYNLRLGSTNLKHQRINFFSFHFPNISQNQVNIFLTPDEASIQQFPFCKKKILNQNKGPNATPTLHVPKWPQHPFPFRKYPRFKTPRSKHPGAATAGWQARPLYTSSVKNPHSTLGVISQITPRWTSLPYASQRPANNRTLYIHNPCLRQGRKKWLWACVNNRTAAAMTLVSYPA